MPLTIQPGFLLRL